MMIFKKVLAVAVISFLIVATKAMGILDELSMGGESDA
jgi:hypothetical protein